jgi:hypothetical protein
MSLAIRKFFFHLLLLVWAEYNRDNRDSNIYKLPEDRPTFDHELLEDHPYSGHELPEGLPSRGSKAVSHLSGSDACSFWLSVNPMTILKESSACPRGQHKYEKDRSEKSSPNHRAANFITTLDYTLMSLML